MTKRDGKILMSITILILIFSYPAMLSFDIFNYIATAKVLFHYQENPYILMPIEFIHDPLLLFMHAANKTALYGFIWIILSGIPSLLGFNNFLLTVLQFKIFVMLFYLGTVYVLWLLTENMFSVIIFALNPLVVIELLVSGHNDSVMMFFALFAFLLLKKNKSLMSVGIIFLSLFIKYATAFLLPVFIYAYIKTIKNEKISWNYIFILATLLMMGVFFFISPLREEIYPWYAIWFLCFSCLLPQIKLLQYFTISLSFGLLLRYVPFMITGNYFGHTPLIKIILTFTPPIIVVLSYVVRTYVFSRE